MESHLMLGLGSGDWVEAAVIVAVVVMPLLGSVAKFFIRKFTPQDKGEGRVSRDPGRTVSRRDTSRTDRPVARPLPPRRVRPVATGHDIDEKPVPARRVSIPVPEPLRDILSEVVPELIPPRVQPPRVRPPKVSSQPDTPRSGKKQRTVSRERRVTTQPAPTARRTKDVRPPKRESVGSIGTRLGAPDARLGHIESNLIDSGVATGRDSASRDELAPFRNPTRKAIRSAIVMNEILGPPVALRGPHDPVN